MFTVGIDSAAIDCVANMLQNPSFLRRVYGEREQQELQKNGMPAQSAAACFAAKEAFGKAMGTGISGFALCDVQLLHEESGKPYLALSGDALALAQQNDCTLLVSVTHEENLATVVVFGVPRAFVKDSASE